MIVIMGVSVLMACIISVMKPLMMNGTKCTVFDKQMLPSQHLLFEEVPDYSSRTTPNKTDCARAIALKLAIKPELES